MFALMLGLALASIDTAIANTALPQIAIGLHTTPAASVWIVNSYQLAMVAAMLPLVALGDKVGPKRVFLVGMVVFVVASLFCALSPNLLTLTLSRVLQGFGASAVMGVVLALIRFIYPPHRLGRGYGLNAMIAGSCMAVGPTVASMLLSVATWPWLFAINIPIGLFGLYFGLKHLPVAPKRNHAFDPVTAVLNGGAFGCLVFGFVEASQQAPLLIILPSLAASALFFLALIAREKGHPAPMLPVDLFRRPMFSLSLITAVCAFCTQGLAFVSLPFYFETVLGRSPIQTGFLMTPWPATVALMAPFAGRLADRYPVGILGGIGLAVLCASMMSLVYMPADPTALGICIRMTFCGIGFGFFQSPNLKAIMSSAPAERAGSGSGMIGTSRLLGQSSGAALVALSFGIFGHHGPTLSLMWGAGLSAAGCAISALRMVGGVPAQTFKR
jgi:DHA2 family multidrug resistance protein-like MFS transporter